VSATRIDGPRPCDVPLVRLLDAREQGLDEEGLRRWARVLPEASGAACVSRSYCYPYALVAWHARPVGVDIERIEPVEEFFAASICTPSERAALSCVIDAAHVTSLWCGKEALAKALGDPVAHDPRRLPAPIGWPNLRAGPWRAAELPTVERHTAWLCWRTGDAPD